MKFLNRFKRNSQADPAGEPGTASLSPTEEPLSETNEIERPKPRSADEISLKLGDFLHRIPAHLLRAGPHDLQKEVCFPIHVLSERINRGETTINLAEIYRQLPEVFRSEVRETDKQQVLYPWRKVITMIKEARGESGELTAAENLAEKIRQKNPSPRPANALAPAKGAQASILRGREKHQASWFNRTTLDKSPELSASEETPLDTPDPSAPIVSEKAEASAATEVPAPAVAPTRPVTPPIPARAAATALKLVSLDQPPGGASIVPPKPTAPTVMAEPPDQKPPSMTTPAAKRTEEAPSGSDLPPDLQRRVATMKGDYERQLAELELARKTYAAEVERLQQELAKTARRLDEEVTANSANRDILQQATRDRETTQKQIKELQARMEGLQKDSRLTAVTAERDALLQQKAHLSKQISELSKRGASPAPRNGDNAAASAVLQRQVEEFQRRISLMEAAQRDTALELAREKEGRAKLEKLLSAAEKLQEQSANYMESAKAEIRKEVEASVKPREIEARKVQKDLQEQLMQATDQNRKLSIELENVRSALTNANASSPATPAPDEFQARAISQLEADIENYRERLKSLLKERDTARAEARDLETRATTSQSSEEFTVEHERLAKELETSRKAQVEQAAALESLRRERAAAEERLAAERAAFEKKTQERAEAGISTENEATAELRRKAEEAAAAAKAAVEELTEIKRRFEELSDTHAKVSAELERERLNRASESEATTARLRDESHSLEQQLSKATSERDKLAQDYAEVAAQFEKDRAASDDLFRKLERDHTDVVHAKEDLTQRLAEAEHKLQSERETARGGGEDSNAAISRLEEELRAAEEKHAALAKELEAALHKRDLLAAELDEEQKKTAGNASRLESELAATRKDLSQAEAKRAELVKELEAARHNDHQLSLSFDQERQKASELAQNLEALAQEREKFTRERADLESQVAASAQTATQLVEQSAAELAEVRAQFNALKVSMAESEERAKDVARQLAEARSDQQYAEAKIADLEAGVLISAEQVESLKRQVNSVREDAEADALSAARHHEEQAVRTRQEFATLQTERDNLSQQRDELQRRLNRITDEHKRLLDDLTAEPTIVPSPSVLEEAQPANVIEVNLPEVLPPDHGNGISIPRVRPMSVPPPKISTL